MTSITESTQEIKPAIVTKFKWTRGQAVFEVPLVEGPRAAGPRNPVGGGTYFYTPDRARCVVVASKTAESYLNQRKYAKYLGRAGYAPSGIDHFELNLGGSL